MNRQYSLKKNKEFNYVYRRGKSVANRNIVLVFVKRKTEGFKIGFSVSKKVGKAVVRNKVKRRLKAAFDEFFEDIQKNTLMIVIARPSIADLEFDAVRSNLKHVLKKADLLLKANHNERR